MKQLEIEFFYPLTEQIPLDLDYSVCEKPKSWTTVPITAVNGGQILTLADPNIKWTTTFTIDDNVVIKTKKLSWFGRLLYRMMGLTWEQKV